MWGVERAGRRGPKPGLTIQQIGTAAVAVADLDGLDGVSMKAVAQTLGVTTMSLYRYVDSKDDLYAVMLDTAYGPPDMSVTARGAWRGRLERWARAVAARRLDHPWSVTVPLKEPPATPNTAGWTECGLQAFQPTNLTAQQRFSSLLLIDGFVQQHVVRGRNALGEEFAIPACLVVTVVEGRITRLDEYLDSRHADVVTARPPKGSP